jgi:hypothetical protein
MLVMDVKPKLNLPPPFDEAMRRHEREIMRFIRRATGDRNDALDLFPGDAEASALAGQLSTDADHRELRTAGAHHLDCRRSHNRDPGGLRIG